jgi:hypothetical protein
VPLEILDALENLEIPEILLLVFLGPLEILDFLEVQELPEIQTLEILGFLAAL